MLLSCTFLQTMAGHACRTYPLHLHWCFQTGTQHNHASEMLQSLDIIGSCLQHLTHDSWRVPKGSKLRQLLCSNLHGAPDKFNVNLLMKRMRVVWCCLSCLGSYVLNQLRDSLNTWNIADQLWENRNTKNNSLKPIDLSCFKSNEQSRTAHLYP